MRFSTYLIPRGFIFVGLIFGGNFLLVSRVLILWVCLYSGEGLYSRFYGMRLIHPEVGKFAETLYISCS